MFIKKLDLKYSNKKELRNPTSIHLHGCKSLIAHKGKIHFFTNAKKDGNTASFAVIVLNFSSNI